MFTTTREELEHKPLALPAPSVDEDHSQLVAAYVGRQPGEEIRCVRVYGNSYRCNWWTHNDAELGSRIRRSSFVRVTKTESGIVVEPVSRR